MKKEFYIWFAIVMVTLLFLADHAHYSKELSAARDEAYAEGYSAGLNDGHISYQQGYEDGMEEGAQKAAYYIEEAQRGTFGEDAIGVLGDFFAGNANWEEAMEAYEWISDYWGSTDAALWRLRRGEANLD